MTRPKLYLCCLLLHLLHTVPSPVQCREQDFIDELHSAWKGHRDFASWLAQYYVQRRAVNNNKKGEDQEVTPVIVDLGVDNGYSTFVWGSSLRGSSGVVYGIDMFHGDIHTGVRDTYDVINHVMDYFDITNVEILRGDFNSFAKIWSKPIDILHIDGGHSYDEVMNDYESWHDFVKEDGVILFHDTTVMFPGFGVHQFFFEELKKRNVAHLGCFGHSSGLGVYSTNAHLMMAIQEEFNDKRGKDVDDEGFFVITHVAG